MNAKWHERHPMPQRATLEQRMAWHREHQLACACRPIPAKLQELMQADRKSAGAAKPPTRKARGTKQTAPKKVRASVR